MNSDLIKGSVGGALPTPNRTALLRVIRNTPQRVPKINPVRLRSGVFVIDTSDFEQLREVFSNRVNVDAELHKAAAWCAENMPRTRNYALFLCAWLKRAAADAALQITGPKLHVICGGQYAKPR